MIVTRKSPRLAADVDPDKENLPSFLNLGEPKRPVGKRAPQPNPKFTKDCVLPTLSNLSHGSGFMHRMSHSDEMVVLAETLSKNPRDLTGSPSKKLFNRLKQECKVPLVSPDDVNVIAQNPRTGTPWKLAKKSDPSQTFVRNSKVKMTSNGSVVQANTFQTEESARKVIKEAIVSDDVENLKQSITPLPSGIYVIPEIEATTASIAAASKEPRIYSSGGHRADDIAASQGKTGPHEHSHFAQHRIFGNIQALLLPTSRRRKRSLDENPVTAPATFEDNSIRAALPENPIVRKYFKANRQMVFSNEAKVTHGVIAEEKNSWRSGKDKIEFEYSAENAFSPAKVTPARETVGITATFFKHALGTPESPDAPPEKKQRKMAPRLLQLG